MRREVGSTATTATRLPRSTSRHPIALMKVDLPAPGTPLMPTRTAPPVASAIEISSSAARSRWSGRVDSSRVMARATCWREPRAHPGGEVRDVDRRHPSRSRRSLTRSIAARLMTVPGG